MFGEVNRIQDAIAEANGLLEGMDADKLAIIDQNATLDFGDWFTMGDWAPRAQQAGLITIDEAMTLYAIHGEEPGTFANASIAERFTYMRVMVELGPRIMGAVV